jgi:outer membrane protein assembly factor BamB
MPRFLAAFALTLTLTLSTFGADAAPVVLFAQPAAPAKAADWPQFLGPNRDDTTKEVVEPWKGDLKPLWKQPVGDAHSSPVVADGIVYAFYQPKGKNADALAAFDAKTGERKWEKSYDRAEYKPPFGNGPRSTPAVSEGKVFTYSGLGILACWDAKTGAIDWKVEPLKEFKTANPFFGTSTSPIVVDGKVIVMVGGKGSGVVAFNVKDGKPVWQATDDPASYSSPTKVGNQLVFLTGAHLLGVSTKGQKLWSVPFEGKVGPIIESSATPIEAGDLVIGSTVSSGAIALKVTEKDGKYTTQEAWRNKTLTCYFSTPVVVGEYLYMVNGTASITNPTITLRCVELKSGKVAWEKKGVGAYHAAILRCGPAGRERLLMLNDEGELTLFEPNAKEFKPLAKSKVCGKTWAHPALVDGRLYLRDEKELVCVELKK